MSTPAAKRSPEEIRSNIERVREELAGSIIELREEVTELTDWRKKIMDNRDRVLIGAAVAGFLVGGGIAAVGGIFRSKK